MSTFVCISNEPVHPFSWLLSFFRNYLEVEIALSADQISKYVDKTQLYINSTLKELRRLFLVQDLVDSIKVITAINISFKNITFPNFSMILLQFQFVLKAHSLILLYWLIQQQSIYWHLLAWMKYYTTFFSYRCLGRNDLFACIFVLYFTTKCPIIFELAFNWWSQTWASPTHFRMKRLF